MGGTTPTDMSVAVAVAAGGALGALARWLTVVQVTRWLGPDFPAGTMAVNVAGSLLMGLLVTLAVEGVNISSEVRAFFAIGFLGSFTTFSAFSLDAVGLVERAQWWPAAAYVVGSVALGAAAFLLGVRMARLFL